MQQVQHASAVGIAEPTHAVRAAVSPNLMGPRAEAKAKVRGVTVDDARTGIAAQTLRGRRAEPEEIDNVAAFLVSDKTAI